MTKILFSIPTSQEQFTDKDFYRLVRDGQKADLKYASIFHYWDRNAILGTKPSVSSDAGGFLFVRG
jgi:hypothetical protein